MTTERISWITKSGKAVEVTVELVTRETLNADGDRVTVACCDLRVNASVDGLSHVGYLNRNVPPAVLNTLPDTAALYGKIAIPAERLSEIDAAIARVHATPEWQAKERAAEERRQGAAEYNAHRNMMRSVMGY